VSLKALQRQWDRYGRTDPLWAVLSLPDKRQGRWDEAEFFATGEREIQDVLAHARSLGVQPNPARALDFGCGVGRLARALVPHFERVDGVDIAPSMLEQAARYNKDPVRCVFHLNERADLALFPDRSFTFIYTSLVLQHVPTDLARGYIREFLRVLAKGGLLVFHLPSEPFPETGRGTARRSFVTGALAAEAFRARVTADVDHVLGNAGQEIALKLRVSNESRHAWPALAGASARHQITLAGRFRTANARLVETAEARSPLPHDLEPGAQCEVFLRVPLPIWPGEYRLEVDLVQEDVAWFHERSGREPLRVPCRARGTPAAEPRLRPERVGEPGQLRRRHPRAHFVLVRLLRLPLLLASAERARSGLAWHARMAWWHAREAWTRLREPPMRMNGIPRPQVEELIRSAGGRLLEAESSELTFAGWQAYRYFVVRE
jgi:SAM-dependent methyltransferase